MGLLSNIRQASRGAGGVQPTSKRLLAPTSGITRYRTEPEFARFMASELRVLPGRPTESMEVIEEVSCPFCGETQPLSIDTSEQSQRFTTDCEVCCRPFDVVVACEPGSIKSLEIVAQ